MTQVSYRERLSIPWWWALVGLLFVVSIALILVFSLDPWLGIAASVLTLVGVGIFLASYSMTTVAVEDGALRAGRNRLEGDYVGGVEALTGDAARTAVGPGADPRAFLFTRPFIRDLVRVHVDDPADSHPYWLVSTRHPDRLARAIEEMA